MAFNLNVFRAQVDGLFNAQDGELSALRRNRFIRDAVEKYSSDKPGLYTEDEAGDGGRYYKLVGTGAVLANWVDDFSQITKIEYPAATIASDETPIYLETEDWQDDYESAGDVYLYLPSHAPAATESMRITYTVPYAWTASSVTSNITQASHGFALNDYVYLEGATWYKADDQRIATHQVTAVTSTSIFTAAVLQVAIPVTDFFAVCNLAAALCCRAIAGHYSRTSDSTINLDSVDHPTRAQMFASQAKALMALYQDHIGTEEGGVKAAGAFVDWDTAPGWPSGRQFIFHGKGTR